jgi:hypothetical protein
LFAVLLQAVVSNTRPPAIAEDQLAVADRREDEASRNLTTLLQRRFPAGSSEGALISTLLNQGFKQSLLTSDQSRCLPVYELRVDPDDHIMRARCDAYDPRKTYEPKSRGWKQVGHGYRFVTSWKFRKIANCEAVQFW